MQLIDSLSIYNQTFYLPPTIVSAMSGPPASYTQSLSAATFLHVIFNKPTQLLPAVHPDLVHNVTPSTMARLFLAAALTPFRGLKYTDSKNKSHFAVEAVIRDGLKLGTRNHYLDGVPLLFTAAQILANPDLS